LGGGFVTGGLCLIPSQGGFRIASWISNWPALTLLPARTGMLATLAVTTAVRLAARGDCTRPNNWICGE
jgi:hypothetical protein